MFRYEMWTGWYSRDGKIELAVYELSFIIGNNINNRESEVIYMENNQLVVNDKSNMESVVTEIKDLIAESRQKVVR